jgi:hypothetical protein
MSDALMLTVVPHKFRVDKPPGAEARRGGTTVRITSRWRQLTQERVGRGEPQGDTGADDEGRVDQAGQQEHLGLQFVHQLGLASGGLEVLAAHDADTDTGTEGAQTNDQTSGESNKANDFHDDSLEGLKEGVEKELLGLNAP